MPHFSLFILIFSYSIWLLVKWVFLFFDFFTNMGIPAGTCKDVGNRDRRKNSPIVGIGDKGGEGLRSRGRGAGRHSDPRPRLAQVTSLSNPTSFIKPIIIYFSIPLLLCF